MQGPPETHTILSLACQSAERSARERWASPPTADALAERDSERVDVPTRRCEARQDRGGKLRRAATAAAPPVLEATQRMLHFPPSLPHRPAPFLAPHTQGCGRLQLAHTSPPTQSPTQRPGPPPLWRGVGRGRRAGWSSRGPVCSAEWAPDKEAQEGETGVCGTAETRTASRFGI